MPKIVNTLILILNEVMVINDMTNISNQLAIDLSIGAPGSHNVISKHASSPVCVWFCVYYLVI